ncbi:TRAP transporter substrate-binding protein DctP [Sulfitobacter sp. 1A12157]|uniref:TRAP transporter substrate-binding protein DctP n=1 Tax=Sulfitobacter sp. 1A12157 TaxID=3368594 RepID=UPI0037458541
MTYFNSIFLGAASIMLATTSLDAKTLSFSSSSPPSSATSQVLKNWADSLEEATGGELEIEFYWQQSLSKLGDNLDAVASGLADMAVVVPAYSRQKLPLNYLSSTSTGTGDPWVISKAWRETREAFPSIAEEEARENVKFLAIESIGPVIFVGDRIYKSPEDLNNATMRLSSHYAYAAQNSGWNVNPARIQSPETYTSLEKGTISGATTYANQLLPFRLNEVADFVTRPDLGQHSNIYYINLEVWEGLSDDHRAAIEASLDDLNLAFAKAEVNEAVTVFDEVQKDATYPMQVYELSEEERTAWAEALEPSYDNNVSKAAEVNPAATEIGQAYKANREAASQELEQGGYPW